MRFATGEVDYSRGELTWASSINETWTTSETIQASSTSSLYDIDQQDGELAHWRGNWQRTIDPRQRVEFIVNIPISRFWSIGGWKLVAFGETEKLQ